MYARFACAKSLLVMRLIWMLRNEKTPAGTGVRWFGNVITVILSWWRKEGKPMSFETKNGPVYEPENEILIYFYEILKKHAPSLSGSRTFADLVEVYQSLDMDLKEEKTHAKTVKAS